MLRLRGPGDDVAHRDDHRARVGFMCVRIASPIKVNHKVQLKSMLKKLKDIGTD